MSQFWELMDDEFGAGYAPTVARSHSVHALGSRTAREALDDGVAPREVWHALCDDLGVPQERRFGVERPRRR